MGITVIIIIMNVRFDPKVTRRTTLYPRPFFLGGEGVDWIGGSGSNCNLGVVVGRIMGLGSVILGFAILDSIASLT